MDSLLKISRGFCNASSLSSDPSGNTVWLPWMGNAFRPDGDVETASSAAATMIPVRRQVNAVRPFGLLPRSLRDVFQRRLLQADFRRRGLQRDDQFLARRADLAWLEAFGIGAAQQARELLNGMFGMQRQLRIRCLERRGKDRLVDKSDSGHVVAHVIERRTAVARFAAIGLALANFVSQPRRAVEQSLRIERYLAYFYIQIGQVINELIGSRRHIGGVGTEQPRFNRVETTQGVRPRVDILVEVRDETADENLRLFPAHARRDPSLLCPVNVVGRRALAQSFGIREGLADLLDEIGAILLGWTQYRLRMS